MQNTRRQQIFLKINLAMLLITAGTFIVSQFLFLTLACVWLLFATIEWNWKERYHTLKENRMLAIAFCFIGLYLCYLISPLLSDNVGKAISDWEYKIWFLVCPICVMPLIPKLQRKELSLAMILFVIPILLWAIASMCHSTVFYLRTGYTFHFFYQHATLPLSLPMSFSHPSYFALYEIIAWIVSAELLLRRNEWLKYRIITILLWGCLLILPVHIFFLQSKMGFVLFGVTLLIYVTVALNRRKRRYALTAIVLAAIIASVGLYIYKEHGRMTKNCDNRIANSFINLKTADRDNPRESSAIRIALWNNAMEIGKDHWFCGIGTGDVLDQLHEKAVEHHYIYISSGKFNCHNQYLQVWLGTGIIGLLLFVSIFCIAFLIGIRKRNLGGAIIIVTFALNLFVECMLERYAGATLIPILTAFICCLPPTMPYAGKSASHSREALPSASCA